jgi:trimeric autotransporter adhesin
MRIISALPKLNASLVQRSALHTFALLALASGSATLFAQIDFTADNLDVGTTKVKVVRIQLTQAQALTSIAIAPGFTEFTAGAVSGCVVDGHTVNPVLTTCILDVTFTPKYPGFRTAPLIVTDSTGAKSSIGLEGTGLAPQAALTPGIITTVAGNGGLGFGGDGGPATDAEIASPSGLATDAAGNLYIADNGNNRIRKVDVNGVITTVAGGGASGLGDGGPATNAELVSPVGVALDAAGNLYIADSGNGRIRKVDVNGVITTVAGGGVGNIYSVGDGGPATNAWLSSPVGVALDAPGNLYIADSGNGRIRKVDVNGVITTVAGGGTNITDPGWPGEYTPSCYLQYTYMGPQNPGIGDGGPATNAVLSTFGVALDASGNIYIADTLGCRIRKVDAAGIITTVAGNSVVSFTGDGGPATSAFLNKPTGIALDAAGNLYIADEWDIRIRRVQADGTIRTVAGSGDNCFCLDLFAGFYYYIGGFGGDGGAATMASLNNPYAVALDGMGNFYIADHDNNRVRKVDVSQSAVTFASRNVGTASSSHRVAVIDTGNRHIDLSGLSLTGDFNRLTGEKADCFDTRLLYAGNSCSLRITFNPATIGALTGSATVTDDSLNRPGTTQTISLTGTGTTP